jgi:hypothetical protein
VRLEIITAGKVAEFSADVICEAISAIEQEQQAKQRYLLHIYGKPIAPTFFTTVS